VAAGEQVDQPPVDPRKLPGAALGGLAPGELVAEPLQYGGQLAGVDRLGSGGELKQRPGVDRRVAALTEGQVEHEGVGLQLRVGWSPHLGGDLCGGAAGVVGEHRHPKLPRGVDLLAVGGRPARRHPRLQLLHGYPDRGQVRPLQPRPLLGRDERQQRRD
jgi:hypothetical protein